jgi:hypothetical protein
MLLVPRFVREIESTAIKYSTSVLLSQMGLETRQAGRWERDQHLQWFLSMKGKWIVVGVLVGISIGTLTKLW